MLASPFSLVNIPVDGASRALPEPNSASDTLAPLLRERPARLAPNTLPAVVLGELVGIADDGVSPLVLFPQSTGHAAVRARSVVDLHGVHIGKTVTLVFELGDETLPIVTGVLRTEAQVPAEAAGQVDVDVDNRRMLVQARDQLVLRCGKASITLTRAGKVLIDGSYVLTRSTGMNRVKGGAVQIN
jgi:hypothetical protein